MRSRNDGWNSEDEVYSSNEVESVLGSLGIEIREETLVEFMSFCPYHGNSDSPAFGTSKRTGLSVCFNPSCAKGFDKRLTLEGLVRDLKGMNHFESKRFITSAKARSGDSFEQKWDAIDEEPKEMFQFSDQTIDMMHERMKNTPEAVEYLVGRGFNKETLSKFKIGYAPAATGYGVPVYRPYDMVLVPAYTHLGKPVGLVGRSIVGKEFKNYGAADKGRGFHKSHIVWNLQNARRSDTIVLTEATFDAMSVHQAGYPNVGALLGGSISVIQRELISRHFEHVVIMTDNETLENGGMTYPKNCNKCMKLGHSYCQGHKAGRDLGMKIAESLPRMKISWATYDDSNIYARGVKDANGMTDDEIRQCLRNAISHYEYIDWLS